MANTLGRHSVGLSLQLPTKNVPPVWFGSGFKDELGDVFAKHLRLGLPWEAARTTDWLEGFRSARESTNPEEIRASPIYEDGFVPHGFEAAPPPPGFTLRAEEDRAMASIVILQRVGPAALDSDDFDLLCQGLSLDEAAERRGMTINTARSQLKQLFVKTSTSRQSELVRLVLAGLPPAIE